MSSMWVYPIRICDPGYLCDLSSESSLHNSMNYSKKFLGGTDSVAQFLLRKSLVTMQSQLTQQVRPASSTQLLAIVNLQCSNDLSSWISIFFFGVQLWGKSINFASVISEMSVVNSPSVLVLLNELNQTAHGFPLVTSGIQQKLSKWSSLPTPFVFSFYSPISLLTSHRNPQYTVSLVSLNASTSKVPWQILFALLFSVLLSCLVYSLLSLISYVYFQT